ncbi:MAG: response regulator transcription factor [Gemmatimonadales bacterium]
MTLRVYLALADPLARRRLRELLGRDPGIRLVSAADDADVVVGDAAATRPVVATAPSEAGTALTPRELDVLRLMAEGLGNKGIAAVLGISAHTAKYHVASVLAKLDVHSRTEAVTRGLREGLLPL